MQQHLLKGSVCILFIVHTHTSIYVSSIHCNRAPESLQPVQQRRDFIDQSEVVVESHDRVTSLESQMVTPPDLLAQGHLHIIR